MPSLLNTPSLPTTPTDKNTSLWVNSLTLQLFPSLTHSIIMLMHLITGIFVSGAKIHEVDKFHILAFEV